MGIRYGGGQRRWEDGAPRVGGYGGGGGGRVGYNEETA